MTEEKMTVARMRVIANRIADADGEPALQRQLLRQMLTELSDAVLAGRCPSPRQCADVAVAVIVRTSRNAR